MTGRSSRLAGPRRGACGSVPDVIATVESTSGACLKYSGGGSGISGAGFSAAC
jgi:hypothetical protein